MILSSTRDLDVTKPHPGFWESSTDSKNTTRNHNAKLPAISIDYDDLRIIVRMKHNWTNRDDYSNQTVWVTDRCKETRCPRRTSHRKDGLCARKMKRFHSMFYPIVTKLNAFRWILSREYLHIDSPSLLNCPRYSTFDVARYEVTKERGV